ncbi:MAG: 1-acyl-sn-glycerol-3-phosphate acyltransferase [Ilumatobacteraceae bacterium]
MTTTSRRLRTVSGLVVAAVLLVALAPLWVPLAVAVDLVRGRTRLPVARLLAFGVCWAWLETGGVLAAVWLWATRRTGDLRAHVRLQRWWALSLMRALRATTGLDIAPPDLSPITPGPAVLLCRHASLADSLLSAWVVVGHAAMDPRYVLKRELLADPCLDIVGNRLRNHFVDRAAPDAEVELAALRALSSDMGERDIAVIFPEGTRAAPAKRERALARIAERDPERASRLAGLRHLLPPRPSGSQALVEGCPTADVVLGWHIGFEGLDTFGGILRHLSTTPRRIEFHARRVARADVPTGPGFARWLDDQWLQMDADVDRLLRS